MLYRYSAVNLEGKRTKGFCDAANDEDLHRRLKSIGLFLISSSVKNTHLKNFLDTGDIKTVLMLCKQLSALIHTGMELTEAINICSGVCRKAGYKHSLQYAYLGLLKGDKLSFCLRKYLKLYPKFMIDMIEIGEETGTLAEILSKLSYYYYQEIKLKNKIRTSLSYPIILSISVIIISFIVTTKVIPEFEGALSTTGSGMPKITSIFISINNFCCDNFLLMIFLILLIILLLRYYISTPKGLKILSSIQLRVFPLNKLLIKLSQIKITGSMYVLLSSSLNPIKSLEVSSSVLTNILLKQKITTCIDNVKKGNSFSKSLESTGIFDSAFISMVRIGEETGNIKDAIEEIIKINEDNMEENINRIVVLIEPLMIIIAALIIVFIVFAALLPALNIMDSLGGQV